jgi:hypothetical protein
VARASGGPFQTGERIRLVTPPDAAIQYGVLHFVKLAEALARDYPELKAPLAVNCGNRGDLAHAAMQLGLRNIVFRGDPRTAEKLAAIAQELGVRFESQPEQSA